MCKGKVKGALNAVKARFCSSFTRGSVVGRLFVFHISRCEMHGELRHMNYSRDSLNTFVRRPVISSRSMDFTDCRENI